ncbi:efflux transporter outer membrane subunit [Pseudolysobacter antarcticus]|uniref:Efflux transporter outer membrane subunit n=1 Tax=Pseudolysobacter antarcticus TaxID=2511995 RepID=A0A411HIR7_9GAMM|nr:efflux transporter outer membrane subunit [Pseudolysobacter antarcticus]QBB70398.1 efflux transporter outer membrane subunit [Pseudolysobacter antarcticus]
MYLKSALSSLAIALSVAGCASMEGLATHGQPRGSNSLATNKSFAALKVSTASWPRRDWWQDLGDPALDVLIAEALQGNPDLAIADARVRQAVAQAQATDALRKPSVKASAGTTGVRIPQTVIPEPIGGHYSTVDQAMLSFSYSFDLWGGKRAAWEAALGQARAASVDAQAVRLTLSANVARAYSQLGYAFVSKDLAQAEIDRTNTLLDLTRQRVDAGIDNQLQLRQTESYLASADERFAEAELGIATSQVTLAGLLGQGPDRGLSIARPRALKPEVVALPSTLPAELLGRRPDVVAARWRVEAASRDIKVAQTQFYPNLNLSIAAGLASMDIGKFLSAGSRFGELAPAISLPIFDGGRLRANLDNKDAEYDLAVAQYNKILVSALNEIANRLTQLHSFDQQLAAEQRAYDSAKAAWDLAMLRYKNGVGSYLEALSVRQALLVAEQGLADLQRQQIDISVQLIEALGGGFNDSEATPAPIPASTITPPIS